MTKRDERLQQLYDAYARAQQERNEKEKLYWTAKEAYIAATQKAEYLYEEWLSVADMSMDEFNAMQELKVP